MSMQDPNDVLEPEHQALPPDVQALLRQGRKAQRDLEDEKARVKSLELQRAIDSAGVPDHPAREIVFKDYEGPFDAESVKAYAEKYGIIAAPAPAPEPSQVEAQVQRQILNASVGAPPASSGDIDAAVAMRNAKSPSEVMAIVQQLAGTPGFKNHDGLIGVLPEF